MIGLDTNVIVRYIMQDDAKQAAAANRTIDALTDDAPGFVSAVALVELVWVLESAYALNRAQIVEALDLLLAVKVIKVERAAIVASATRSYARGNADFAVCMIERACANAGCVQTLTFDRAAAKSGGMVLLR